MSYIILKIDVDTLHGSRIGVPRLARMLDAAQAQATFLFSLGPDHTGWALRRLFRPGFFSKVSRTSVLKHYGLRTLLYGTLLPGPDIGRRCATELRAIAQAGFECGIHCWDHVYWQDNVRERDSDWTQRQMQRAYQRFTEIFDKPPTTHGAAGWQMNAAAFHQLDDWQLAYASDGRGHSPHRLSIDGTTLAHIQMPTTLPTLDELIGLQGIDTDNVAAHLLQRTAHHQRDEVFTLHAELEGQRLAPIFQQLLDGWRAQGHQLISMADYYCQLKPLVLPIVPLHWGSIPGRSGEVVLQQSTSV